MKRLVIIDGNAILHRSYHALPPLTSPDGSPVGAIYGFVSILLKLWHDFKPSHLAVAFDRPAPTFRKEIFAQYQAKRPKMEDELASQVDKVHDLLAAFKVAVVEIDGFEADDIIGTLAGAASEAMDQIIIVTGDRDLLQLVNEKVFVYMPVRGLSVARLFDTQAVVETFGVKPGQVADFKAIAGDPSDNYPGVPGIGPKRAAGLLASFGTLEEVFREAKNKNSRIPESVKLKLLKCEMDADTLKLLSTIRRDAPVGLTGEDLRLESLDTPGARGTLMNFNFPSLVKRLDKLQVAARPGPDDKRKNKIRQKKSGDGQLALV